MTSPTGRGVLGRPRMTTMRAFRAISGNHAGAERSRELRHIVRVVTAGCISWQICIWLGADAPPVFAVIVPIVAIQEQPLSAMNVSFARVGGVLAGVAIGVLILEFLEPTTLSVAIVLALTLVCGMVPRSGRPWNIQIAVSALLVFASDHPGTYAIDRLWETVVGAIVTVALSALVLPGDPSQHLKRDTESLRQRLIADLGAVAGSLRGGTPIGASTIAEAEQTREVARTLDADLRGARSAYKHAPLRRRVRKRLATLEVVVARGVQLAERQYHFIDELPVLLSRGDVVASETSVRDELAQSLVLFVTALHTLFYETPGGGETDQDPVSDLDQLLGRWQRQSRSVGELLVRRHLRLMLEALSPPRPAD